MKQIFIVTKLFWTKSLFQQTFSNRRYKKSL